MSEKEHCPECGEAHTPGNHDEGFRAQEVSVLTRMAERRDGIRAWLEEHEPQVFRLQSHLDGGSVERAYWHYGYYVALVDALRLFAEPARDPSGRPSGEPGGEQGRLG